MTRQVQRRLLDYLGGGLEGRGVSRRGVSFSDLGFASLEGHEEAHGPFAGSWYRYARIDTSDYCISLD